MAVVGRETAFTVIKARMNMESVSLCIRIPLVVVVVPLLVLLAVSSDGIYGFTTPPSSHSSSSSASAFVLPTPPSSSTTTLTLKTRILTQPRILHRLQALTKDKKETTTATKVNGDDTDNNDGATAVDISKVEKVNGDSRDATSATSVTTTTTTLSDFNSSHVSEIFDEINRRISDGSTELIQNITTVVDEQMPQLNETAAQELTAYLSDLAIRLQKAQQDEVAKQLNELEKLFLDPIERVAFSDAPLFELDRNSKALNDTLVEVREQDKLILTGENSTLRSSSRMRTAELIRNFNVAPLYYSIALLYRWFQKASYPSIYLLSAYKGMANIVKTSGGPRRRWRRKRKKVEESEDAEYAEYMKEAEAFQAGWKRTGEIAAKGPLAKKWAILRRSAEIWAYFSSFYLKDRRICNKYNSGRWSEEKFKAERSKLGAEITQNLLRLGPTFIKVRVFES